MKKLILVAFGSFFLIATSCKKEYTCTCVTGVTGTVTTETNKGKDATDACDDLTSVVQLKACVPA